MTDVPDLDGLARRYLDLWEEQAIAWAGDATLADSLRLWLGFAGMGPVGATRTGPGGEGDSWHGRGNHIGGPRQPEPGAAARSAPAAGASGNGDDDMARLTRRLAALERRLARLEAGVPPAAGRDRAGLAGRRAKRVRRRGRPRD